MDWFHVALRKADHLAPSEDSFLSIGIEVLEGGVIVKDLIHTVVVDFIPEAAKSVPGSENPDYKLGGVLSEEGIKDGAKPVSERGAPRLLGRHREIIAVGIVCFPADNGSTN